MGNKKKQSSKSKKLIIWIIAVIALVAAAATTIIIIVMSLGKHITLEDIKEYCRKNSYATSKLNIDTSRLSDEPLIETAITCKSSINTISFYTFYEPAPESWFTDSTPSDGTIIILGEGKNYIKIYHDPDVGASYDGYHHNYVVYGIVDGKEIITVSSPDEATARRILLEIGYPDKEWYTGQR